MPAEPVQGCPADDPLPLPPTRGAAIALATSESRGRLTTDESFAADAAGLRVGQPLSRRWKADGPLRSEDEHSGVAARRGALERSMPMQVG